MKSKTIVAIATAYGKGSISIIRLSGPKAYELALKASKKEFLKPRHAYFTSFYDAKDGFIDEGILLYFKAPHSFTGEDVVEFQIHGGVISSQELISELLKRGACLAGHGEFSKLACLNGKMDVLKALSINELINSKSKAQARLNAKNMQGELSKLFIKQKEALIKALAFVEASIDYADELPDSTKDELFKMCEANEKELLKLVNTSKLKEGLIKGFKIAIIGKPNVGKSTLLNALLAYERAITSSTAGTTRDLIEEELIIGSHIIRLIDTAGIRHTDDEIEAKGIELSLKSLDEADIVLALFDASKPLDEEDKQILKRLKNSSKKCFFILNKLDIAKLVSKSDLGVSEVIKLDKTKDLSSLQEALRLYLNTQDSEDLVLSNTLLINSCEKAALAFKNARQNKDELELFAFWLNEALEALGVFAGEFKHEDLLDSMFSSFCLGK